MVNNWPIIAQLFGSSCVLCRQPGDLICPRCIAAMPYNDHACRQCALPLPPSAPRLSLCADCQTHPPAFDHVIAPLRYAPPVDDLVAGFKYHHRLALGRSLTGLLAGAIDTAVDPPDLLLPIPAGSARLRERGFNQAAEIARGLSRHLHIPWSSRHLVRSGSAGQQRKLSRLNRRRNARGMFLCVGDLPPRVAVIDDVMTTGATAEEAAHSLKRAGVAHVEVWTVARTPRDG